MSPPHTPQHEIGLNDYTRERSEVKHAAPGSGVEKVLGVLHNRIFMIITGQVSQES